MMQDLEKHAPAVYIQKTSDKISELAKEITVGAGSDEEKLYKICEWVCENIAYNGDMNGKSLSPKDPLYKDIEIIIEPDDVLENRSTICSGYSKLVKALCNAVDIPAVYITGDTPLGPHAWNAIYIANKWVLVDNTWNDSDYNSEWESEVFDFNRLDYETYLQNEELKEDYTWEEIQQLMTVGMTFAENHPYYELGDIPFSSCHIVEEYE